MKLNILFFLLFFLIFSSCEKKMYEGTYNTNYSRDKSSFIQLKLNKKGLAEKIEIHTINDIAIGTWVQKNNRIICYLNSSKSGLPPDTLNIKIRGNKLYFFKGNKLNKKFYLLKN